MQQGGWLTGAVKAAALGLAVLCGGALAGAARAAPINLVKNGDFTGTTLASPGGYVCNQASNAACGSVVTSWAFTCGINGCQGGGTPTSILFPGKNGTAWNGGIGLYSQPDAPVSGNVLADDSDGAYASTASQAITGLTIGHSYTLTFYQAAAQQSGTTGDTTEQWQVGLAGATKTSDLMKNPSGGFVAWSKQTLTYTATKASDTLTFLSIGGPGGLPPVSLLAGVTLFDTTPVPEPAALSLLGAGLLGLVAARRRAARAG